MDEFFLIHEQTCTQVFNDLLFMKVECNLGRKEKEREQRRDIILRILSEIKWNKNKQLNKTKIEKRLQL